MIKEENTVISEDLIEVLKQFQIFKKGYEEYKHENSSLKAKMNRLEAEVQASHESEKSHRSNLSTSRKMIIDLQNNISHLVTIKVDMKKMSLELEQTKCLMANVEKEKLSLIDKHECDIAKLKKAHQQEMNVLKLECEKKATDLQNETDTDVAQSACLIQELNKKITEVQNDTNDKTNIIVLDYEEKLQKVHANFSQLENEHSALIVRSNTNIEVYQKRIADLEEKLRSGERDQNAFKSYPTEKFNNHFPKAKIVTEKAASFYKNTTNKANNSFKPASKVHFTPLQVVNISDNSQNSLVNNVEKRSTFSVVKKRKLYTAKDHLQ